MFTGLIQHVGIVAEIKINDFGRQLGLMKDGWSHEPHVGESIAVNGCCLTVSSFPKTQSLLWFDVISQTLEVTAIGDLKVADPVNLEHAVTLQTMLGGHLVQGHIDGVGVVTRVVSESTQRRLRIQPPVAAMETILEKGSIAVNGVSLTVAAVGSDDQDWFEVALIPTTLQLTNLGSLTNGSRVNLETDYLAKIVVNRINRSRR